MNILSGVLLLVIFLVTAGFVYVKWLYGYWSRYGIPHDKPHFLWGSLRGIGRSFSMGEKMKLIYEQHKPKSGIVGMFLMIKPVPIICDLDLIKTVLIKDFHKLSDRGLYWNEKDDPLSANILNLPEDRWRFLRSKLSPTFSSGKLKLMMPIVNSLGDKLVEKLRESDGEDVNSREIFSRYTTDVIGNCAFGLDCNSLNDPENEFLEKGNLIFNSPKRRPIRRTLTIVFGALSRRLGITNSDENISSFYYNIVRQTVDYREREDIKRDDFLDLLLKMKANSELTFDEVAAQVFIFQLAGYETSSITLTFASYELVMNPDVQERARKEIRSVVKHFDNELCYEAVFNMPFLDQVVNEALRKYPPALNLFRRVVDATYNIPGTPVTMKKDDLIAVSIMGIHHDPQLYPDPEKYDPDRFLPDQVQNRHPMAFIPFGEGPRNCIGLRFALMEIKLALSKLLLNFRMEPGTDFPKKIKFSPRGIVLKPDGDIRIRFLPL